MGSKVANNLEISNGSLSPVVLFKICTLMDMDKVWASSISPQILSCKWVEKERIWDTVVSRN